MNLAEIQQKCKDLGMKGYKGVKKNDLLKKLQEYKPKKELPTFLVELHEKIPKDMLRKVCKNCGELGHGIASIDCKLNMDKKEAIKQKIKQYFLAQDGSNDSAHFKQLSEQLGISWNQCKNFYGEIPWIELLRRENIVDTILQKLCFKSCEQCNQNKCTVKSNPFRLWKGKNICDKCFKDTFEEREEMWRLVTQYKPIHCSFCKMKREHKDERFHFDHVNMFDKEGTIYGMIMEGLNIEQIYKEIDKCQILCISCHDIVTYTERILGFTKQKQGLTRKLNQEEITKEEYEIQQQKYQEIYEEIIVPIYKTIKDKHL